ncbi:hypothetical protein GCM10010975_31370 [Comamonas phosphati]|nr:hypothetical protein GCM10010975_31370 [Comamonas phosphati]
MPNLDLPTIIAYAGGMACIVGLILAVLGRSFPASIQGWGYWAGGALVGGGLGMLTRGWLRSMAPEDVAIAAQNICLIMTAGLFLVGTCRLFEWPLPRHFLLVLFGAAVLASCIFFGYESAAIHRRIFARSLLATLYAYHAWVVIRQPRTLATRVTVSTLVALVALLLLRAVSGYLFPESDGIHSVAWLQQAYAVGFSSTDVLIPMCAILMMSEKLRGALEHETMHDSLTGLPNRRAVLTELDRLFTLAKRTKMFVLVVFIDLDGFKKINDTYGHEVGDQFLAEAGRRISTGLRSGDMLGRMSGDEFVVLGLMHPTEPSCDTAMDAIRDRLTPQLIGNFAFAGSSFDYAGASFGLVAADPAASSPEATLRAADERMYAEKRTKRMLEVA